MRNTLDRREFTRLSVLSMLSGVVITVTGCGGGSSPSGPNPGPTPGNGDKAGVISANHGHSVFITAAQMTAGNQVLLTLQGSSGVPEHTHQVTLTAPEVVSVSNGTRVAKTSTVNDAHDHVVTFN
jgi:hypothetical protein